MERNKTCNGWGLGFFNKALTRTIVTTLVIVGLIFVFSYMLT